MAIVIRHGGGSHVMRPDGVMRTSVIQPFVGFNPQADVQAVAQAFTTGGPLATTLGGFRGVTPPGRIKQWWANFKAKRAGLFVGAGNAAGPATLPGPGAPTAIASQVAPQIQTQMIFLQQMTDQQNSQDIAAAANTLSNRAAFYRMPGH